MPTSPTTRSATLIQPAWRTKAEVATQAEERTGLAHLYVLCKGGDGEVGPDSFSLKRAQRESTSSEAKAPGRQRHESPPLPKTAKCQPPQSRSARVGAGAGAVAVEQLSELCFRGRGRGANQSVERDQDENPGVGSMSPHLYKKRKGGPAPTRNHERAAAKLCPALKLAHSSQKTA